MTIPTVPHAIKITNLTSAKIPISSGMILQGGAVTTFRPTRLQDVEQALPILNTLVSHGKISYQIIPSEGGVSGLNLVRFGAYGALGTSTVFVRPSFATNASDNVGWLAPERVRLRNLIANIGTAAGAGQSVTLYVYIAGAQTALACAIGGATATSGSDPNNYVDVLPGTIIKMQLVPSAGSSAADLSGSFEMA